ncbi:hypothetical protein Syun_029746 [Stephania yunnanensis]|uniref:Uncharacterized protein n=1 Tax=Stephania yunnanensis TaxID=152371 RepID=A0AAP0E9I3_9MAGN
MNGEGTVNQLTGQVMIAIIDLRSPEASVTSSAVDLDPNPLQPISCGVWRCSLFFATFCWL